MASIKGYEERHFQKLKYGLGDLRCAWLGVSCGFLNDGVGKAGITTMIIKAFLLTPIPEMRSLSIMHALAVVE